MADFYSEQQILQRCFVNATDKLKAKGFHSAQDYFRAVFDDTSDAIRISFEGGGGLGDANTVSLDKFDGFSDIEDVISSLLFNTPTKGIVDYSYDENDMLLKKEWFYDEAKTIPLCETLFTYDASDFLLTKTIEDKINNDLYTYTYVWNVDEFGDKTTLKTKKMEL